MPAPMAGSKVRAVALVPGQRDTEPGLNLNRQMSNFILFCALNPLLVKDEKLHREMGIRNMV